MKTGVELISKEREEQITKHGFSDAHDDDELFHGSGELKEAAMFLLSDGSCAFPSNWDYNRKLKFFKKSKIEKLIIAGALIAAEIDRINRLN